MFGTSTTGDTSGYGGLQVRRAPQLASPRPYGSYFDELADSLAAAMGQAGASYEDAIPMVVVSNGELTMHVRREHLLAVAGVLRNEPSLSFEMCLGVSGVHYPADTGAELHAVYHLLSITHNRRIRLEVTAPDADPHIPSLVDVYPTCDWHERETWDFFGVIFDGHPGADQDRDARRLARPPAAEGLPARRHPGGVPRRDDPAAGRAEGVPVSAGTEICGAGRGTRPRATTRPRAASITSAARTGTRSSRPRSRRSSRPVTSGWSSTWARSTRRRTACSGWC